MKLLTTAYEIGNEISKCIENKKYNHISFAVAWIKNNAVYNKLLKHRKKIKDSTVGIDFAGTDKAVLEELKSFNVKICKNDRNSTFHPKIYLFYNDKKEYTAIIGSANLTNGGINNNDECAILFTEKNNSKMYSKLIKQLKTYFKKAKPITNVLLDEYSILIDNIDTKNKEIKNISSVNKINKIIDETPYINLIWDNVSNLILEYDFELRKEMLNNIQEIFSNMHKNKQNFEDLDIDSRRKIIGNAKKYDNIYKAFGGIGNAGLAQGIMINENNDYPNVLHDIGKALHSIPVLTHKSFKKFPEYEVRIFLERVLRIDGCGISTATRLLTVKRPDLFVCINSERKKEKFKGNKATIEEIFRITFPNKGKNNVNVDKIIDNYIKLLKMIYNTDYYNHIITEEEKSKNKNLEVISMYRAAFLDSYFQEWKEK